MIVGYVRVSTNKQELKNQRLEILEWGNREKMQIDRWVEANMSSRRSLVDRGIENLVESLETGDLLVVAELSRLGRSLIQVVQVVNDLVAKGVQVVSLKENLNINSGKQDISTKVTVFLFGMLAEIERDLISERTKAGLARAREEGKRLGRPKGTTGKSKLDPHREEIQGYLDKKISQASIAKLVGCSKNALSNFIRSRGLKKS